MARGLEGRVPVVVGLLAPGAGPLAIVVAGMDGWMKYEIEVEIECGLVEWIEAKQRRWLISLSSLLPCPILLLLHSSINWDWETDSNWFPT